MIIRDKMDAAGMSFDDGQHEAPAALSAAVPDDITVEQGPLRTPQKIHALAIVIIPLGGVIAAIALAATNGVTAVDFGLLIVMYSITMLGISVGYHRLFSHRSFKAITPVRAALGIAGSLAAQGSPVYWVSNHRRHHQYTDKPGDIHSPYYKDVEQMGIVQGFWHSHMGWTFGHKMTNALLFAKDLYRDPAIMRVNRLYYLWVFLGLAIPFVIGGALTQTWIGAISGFLWGGLVRIFLCYHFTNGIDSVTHIFGRQVFKTGDYSTNNVWWAMPTMGEGWHNNHHAFPSSAIFGLKWWQIDLGAWLVRGLEKLGWVWNVNVPTPAMIAAHPRAAA